MSKGTELPYNSDEFSFGCLQRIAESLEKMQQQCKMYDALLGLVSRQSPKVEKVEIPKSRAALYRLEAFPVIGKTAFSGGDKANAPEINIRARKAIRKLNLGVDCCNPDWAAILANGVTWSDIGDFPNVGSTTIECLKKHAAHFGVTLPE